MRRVFYVLFVVAVLLPCASAFSEGAAPDVPEGWKTYTDSEYGFAISYPPEWVVVHDPDPARHVSLQDIPPDMMMSFMIVESGEGCDVVATHDERLTRQATEGLTADEDIAMTVDAFSDHGTNVRVMDRSEIQLSGKEAVSTLVYYTVDAGPGAPPVRVATMLVMVELVGAVYGVSCSAPLDAFSNLIPVFGDVVFSFHLLP